MPFFMAFNVLILNKNLSKEGFGHLTDETVSLQHLVVISETTNQLTPAFHSITSWLCPLPGDPSRGPLLSSNASGQWEVRHWQTQLLRVPLQRASAGGGGPPEP
jgi:hypothetical protein